MRLFSSATAAWSAGKAARPEISFLVSKFKVNSIANPVLKHGKHTKHQKHKLPTINPDNENLSFKSNTKLIALINEQCKAYDFTTAKALLRECISIVGGSGVCAFVRHSMFASGNAADILDFYRRLCQIQKPLPHEAALVLQSLTYLNNPVYFNECWDLTSKFFDPAENASTLLAKMLDFMLDENWSSAEKTWKAAEQLPSFSVADKDLLFTLACRFFLLDSHNVDNVHSILKLMKEVNISPSSQLTSILFQYLVPVYRGSDLPFWINYATENNWNINGECIMALVRTRYNSVPRAQYRKLFRAAYSKLPKELKLFPKLAPRSFERIMLNMISKNTLASYNQPITNLHEYDSNPEPRRVFIMKILDNLQKMGIKLRYNVLVEAFVKLKSPSDVEDREKVKMLMKLNDYPIHCVETDFAMIEYYAKMNKYDKTLCDTLISEFLIQYPLLTLNLEMLTKLGWYLVNTQDFERAIMVGDHLRERQFPRSENINSSNHDHKSIFLLLWCMFRLKEPLVPFLRQILTENVDIYFDETFINSVRKLLTYTGEDLDILEDIKLSNNRYMQKMLMDIDTVIDIAMKARNDRRKLNSSKKIVS